MKGQLIDSTLLHQLPHVGFCNVSHDGFVCFYPDPLTCFVLELDVRQTKVDSETALEHRLMLSQNCLPIAAEVSTLRVVMPILLAEKIFGVTRPEIILRIVVVNTAVQFGADTEEPELLGPMLGLAVHYRLEIWSLNYAW